MPGFLTPLRLEFIDGHSWRVLEKFEYCLKEPDAPERVFVFTDFITDFASVPRGLWNLLPPTGKYGKAAVIHDYLYQYRKIFDTRTPDTFRLCERGEADSILKEAAQVLGVSWFTRQVLYAGVRVGGWAAWNGHRKAEG